MNTIHLQRVRRFFSNDMVPRHVQRHNMRAWVKSVRYLGDKWLLARPMQKQQGPTK